MQTSSNAFTLSGPAINRKGLRLLLLCFVVASDRVRVAEPMTNADIINELKLLKDSGHPVSAMVVLYAGMVNVRQFDRPGCTAKDAALALLQMVRTSPSRMAE